MKRLSSSLLPLVLVAAGWSAGSHSRVFVYQERIRGVRANPVFVDGVEVASLRQRWSYFVLDLAPGEHAISGRHKENELVLEAQAGKDYYVRLDQIMAVGAGEKLTMPSCLEVRAVIDSGKLHPIEPADVRDHARVSLTIAAPACAE